MDCNAGLELNRTKRPKIALFVNVDAVGAEISSARLAHLVSQGSEFRQVIPANITNQLFHAKSPALQDYMENGLKPAKTQVRSLFYFPDIRLERIGNWIGTQSLSRENAMKICVVGTGYVGLVSGVCWAEMGHDITCVDNDSKKIDMLRNGQSPIYEPGLEDLMKKNSNRIFFTTDLASVVNDNDLLVIGVGTPQKDNGEANLTYVFAVAQEIADALTSDIPLVVVKSTVPIGTNDEVEKIVCAKIPNAAIVSNPEFLREGTAVKDFLHPDRVVVGTNSARARQIMADAYCGQNVIFMQRRSAEMTKYVANCILACRLTFMNEMSRLCEELGADVQDVRQGIGSDRRIGTAFLAVGPGWGGSCFPKDVSALDFIAEARGVDTPVLSSIVYSNTLQKQYAAVKVIKFFEGDLTGKKIAIWGLAFKADTDDVRDSSALDVVSILADHGAELVLHDPIASDNFKKCSSASATYASSPEEATIGADAIVVLTDWDCYKSVSWPQIGASMMQKVVFDFRNMLDDAQLSDNGFVLKRLGA